MYSLSHFCTRRSNRTLHKIKEGYRGLQCGLWLHKREEHVDHAYPEAYEKYEKEIAKEQMVLGLARKKSRRRIDAIHRDYGIFWEQGPLQEVQSSSTRFYFKSYSSHCQRLHFSIYG